MDDVFLCLLELMVFNVCDIEIDCIDEEFLFNIINWISFVEFCFEVGGDVVGFDIFYVLIEDGNFE